MTRSTGAAFFVSLAFVVACHGATAHEVAAPVPAPSSPAVRPEASAEPPRSDGRLPSTVAPSHYALRLRIDPAATRFSGDTTIDVVVAEPTTSIVLHGRDLVIRRAVVRAGGAELSATVSTRVPHRGVHPEELVLGLERAVAAGPAQIEIEYDAPFASDLAGLYRVEEAGRPYVYSQFEVADARRAFPGFDEPSNKTPFDVTIDAPPGLTALTNSPETSTAALSDGWIAHHFATSRPLPTYLVAFAVGDFDVVEWTKDPFPIRAITTKGKSALTALALDTASALVARLGDYFGQPYPYPKLDLVAVPDFAAGGMENPGLITFRDAILLLDPRRATVAARRGQASTIAHELAHQWFGDLVTLKWWNDLWLNEGFATWAQAKILDAWHPWFSATLDQLAGLQRVMDTDALRSARAVREPVSSKSDAEEAFDGMTYDKGAAILRMIEGWLGEDVFRRGVQRYLHEHAWGSASAEDLFASLEYVSTQKIGALAGRFLDQPGVPDVIVGWTCAPSVGNKLTLSQSEWRPLGGAPASHAWTLPVCVESDTLKGKTCFTLGREFIARDLGPTCPAWVHPNAAQAGYYRFVLDAAHLSALAHGGAALSVIDRLGLVADAWAEVRQGVVPPRTLLDLLPAFDGESNRAVVEQIIATLQGVDTALVDDESRPGFQRYVAARLAARKAALGWRGGPEEDDERVLLRRAIMWGMAEVARDRQTIDEADQIAETWLRDPSSVSPDSAAAALPIASMAAGETRLTQLRAAADHAQTPEDRVLAIRAMGTFDDPAVLRRALDWTLSGDLKVSEVRYLFGSALTHRPARATLYAWEKENWKKIRARLAGSYGRPILVSVIGTLCSRAEHDDARSFFVGATEGIEGLQRPLEEALETAELCATLREHGGLYFGNRAKP